MIESFVISLGNLLGQNEYLFVHEMVSFLGGVNMILAVVGGSLFALRRLNKHVLSNKNAFVKQLLKPLGKAHPYVGGVLLLTAYFHGVLALGTVFKWHTGSLIWWILLTMMIVALVRKKYRVKRWLKIHRALAAFFAFSIMLHLLTV